MAVMMSGINYLCKPLVSYPEFLSSIPEAVIEVL